MSTSTSTASSPKQKRRADYYQLATNRIIALLEKGVPPWRKTWGTYGLARNYASGHVYQGINMLMLNLVSPYEIPLYMSRKQISAQGGKISKGSKPEWVYFYGDYYKDSSGKTVPTDQVEARIHGSEELQRIRFLKTRPIYNVSCVEGIDIEVPSMPKRENNSIEACEALLGELNPKPRYETTETDRPAYSPDKDQIRIPSKEYFDNSEEFYCTLFHEIVHWTGHATRLDRVGVTSKEATFGTKLYAEEELIAEFGASYLCAITGIDHEALVENSTAYIQAWIKRLQEDKKLIFRVAARAQQAISFLMGEE